MLSLGLIDMISYKCLQEFPEFIVSSFCVWAFGKKKSCWRFSLLFAGGFLTAAGSPSRSAKVAEPKPPGPKKQKVSMEGSHGSVGVGFA